MPGPVLLALPGAGQGRRDRSGLEVEAAAGERPVLDRAASQAETRDRNPVAAKIERAGLLVERADGAAERTCDVEAPALLIVAALSVPDTFTVPAFVRLMADSVPVEASVPPALLAKAPVLSAPALMMLAALSMLTKVAVAPASTLKVALLASPLLWVMLPPAPSSSVPALMVVRPA